MSKSKKIIKEASTVVLSIILIFAIIFALMGTWHLVFTQIPYFPTIFATSLIAITCTFYIIGIYKFGKSQDEKITWKNAAKIIAAILILSLFLSQIPDLCNYETGYCNDMPTVTKLKIFIWVFFSILIPYFFGRLEK